MNATLAKFEADLQLRRLSPITVSTYVSCCRCLLKGFDGRVAEVTRADIEAYLHGMLRSGRHGPAAQRQHTSAIRALFRYSLDRPEVVAWLPMAKMAKPLPKTVSPEQIEAALRRSDSQRVRALIMLSYGAGLRASEACNLQVRDIRSADGVIHVRAGKGNKDRLVMLSPRLLEQLRRYWPERQRRHPHADVGRPREQAWLFPGGGRGGKPLSRAWASKLWHRAQRAAGMKDTVGLHSLRHAFATGLLDSGSDLRTVQVLLGHARMATTLRYLRLQARHIGSVVSPLDHFAPPPPPAPAPAAK